ncbi:hypothetical protein [Bosea sp. AAP35]|uniref:hypothetical protein n=1 Tax=Bosea sp. AAP35 TaxID=1523417 RepID=UPI000A5A2061|nr:hypothetical protein [Bosea sp. AAP35]
MVRETRLAIVAITCGGLWFLAAPASAAPVAGQVVAAEAGLGQKAQYDGRPQRGFRQNDGSRRYGVRPGDGGPRRAYGQPRHSGPPLVSPQKLFVPPPPLFVPPPPLFVPPAPVFGPRY